MHKYILPLIITSVNCFSQAPEIEWENKIGENRDDYCSSVVLNTDDGFIFGGKSLSNISGDKTENTNGLLYYMIMKLDSTGLFELGNTTGLFIKQTPI